MMKDNINHLIQTIALGSILSVSLSCTLTYTLPTLDHYETNFQTTQSNLQNILSSLQDVETGTRGFALTLKPEYLEPYNSGKKNTIGLMSFLDEFQGSPLIISNLKFCIKDKLKIDADAIQDLKSGIPPNELKNQPNRLEYSRAKATMDNIRLDIAILQDHNKKRYIQHINRLKIYSIILLGTIILVSVISFMNLYKLRKMLMRS